MRNGRLEQFLDTGWYSEATLWLNGYVYWCEAQRDVSTGMTHFFVDKWEAENENNMYYHSRLEMDGTLKWDRVFEVNTEDIDLAKKQFLEATIFDGKSFWQVEKQIAWLEEATPVSKK